MSERRDLTEQEANTGSADLQNVWVPSSSGGQLLVCVPTPSGTARISSSCWPKIISEKTTQKTNMTSPQMRPEVTEATADWRDMPRSARIASRHTSTSAAQAAVTGWRRRYVRPACRFLVSGSTDPATSA